MYLDNKYCHFVTVIFTILSYLVDGQQICDSTTCKAPNCHCSGVNIPGGFHPEDIPQMVLLSFDDAVNWDNWDYYMKLFPPDGHRKNPNGCPISMTLFVSHNYTDYCMVRKLHGRGIEIADHSLTHQVTTTTRSTAFIRLFVSIPIPLALWSKARAMLSVLFGFTDILFSYSFKMAALSNVAFFTLKR